MTLHLCRPRCRGVGSSKLRPSGVSSYSTRGVEPAWAVRVIMPSRSSARIVAGDVTDSSVAQLAEDHEIDIPKHHRTHLGVEEG
jgi:hypothetical protein